MHQNAATPPQRVRQRSAVSQSQSQVLMFMHVAEDIEELRFPYSHDSFSREQKRLWATLCFRLAMKLTDSGLLDLHTCVRDGTTNKLLQEFRSEASHTNTTEALKKCILLCQVSVSGSTINQENAAGLLMGIPEVELGEAIERQVSNIIIIDDDGECNVSCKLKCLLIIKDPKYRVYRDGRDRLMSMLNSPDFLSQTQLEVAYSWTLSCQSAVGGELKFPVQLHVI